MEFLEAWLKHGLMILVSPGNRLLLLSSSEVQQKIDRKRDVEILLPQGTAPKPGDWILILSHRRAARIILFARINRCKNIAGHCRAFSSLFWHFAQGGPVVWQASLPLRSLPSGKSIGLRHEAVIRRLLMWIARHYRIGFV
jgi:hypothetical protein